MKWPVLDRRRGRSGKVTSAIYSPRLGKNIGYCWLPAERSARGQRGHGRDASGGQRTATVVAMPFVDPEKPIPVS